MTASVTLKNIYEEILAQNSVLGLVLPGITGTTTQLTLANAVLSGPFPSQRIQRGSPVRITAGGTPNDNTYVNLYTPSTGVATLSPSITTGATDAILGYYDTFDHFDRMKEAINRAHQNRLMRWELRPLTYVPDGGLQGTTVTDYWTAAANGTAAYANAQTFPAGSAADAVGSVGLNRVLQLTTSGGSSSVAGNGMRVVLSTRQQSWYFQTAIRLVSGSGTVTFSIRDNTNAAAAITLQVTRGNDSQTLTTTSLGDYMICEGTFQVPATCAEVAPRLDCDTTGMVAQMGPVIMFPQDANAFPLPNRLMTSDDVGNFRYATSYSGPGSISSLGFSEPITLGDNRHRIYDYGDHMTVEFNFRPSRPVWFEEAVYGAALSAMTDTTTFPLETVVRNATWELAKWLKKKDVTRWGLFAAEAKRNARGYGQSDPIMIRGRVA